MKKTNLLSLLKKGMFLVVLISTLSSLVFAASKTNNAKKFYMDLLENAQKHMDSLSESSGIGAKVGEIVINEVSKVSYTDDVKKLYRDFYSKFYDDNIEELKEEFPDKDAAIEDAMQGYVDSEDKQDITITFDKEKDLFHVNKNNVKYLYDSKADKIYVEKEDGSVVYCEPTYEMVSDVSSLVGNNNIAEFQASSMILKNVINNLKDDYFKEEKKNNVNTYILSMNKNQMIELIENVFNGLLKDQEFKALVLSQGVSEEEYESTIKDVIDEAKEALSEIENFKFEIRVSLKAKKLSAFGFELVMDNNCFKLDIKGEDGKELLKSKKLSFNLEFVTEDEEYKINGNVSIDNKKIAFELNTHEKYGYYQKYETNYTYSVVFETLDNKEFKKSNKMQFTIVEQEDDNNIYDLKVIVSTNDKKSLDKSKEITAEVFENDEDELDGKFIIKGTDNKELLKSSEIKIEDYIGDSQKSSEEVIITAIDKKELLKSSNIEIKDCDDYRTKLLLGIKANDKKSIMESHNIEITDYSVAYGEYGPDIYVIKANDNNNFFESKDIEISYTSDRTYRDTFEIKIKSLDNKAFKESEKIKVEGRVDDVEFTLELESLDKKSLFKANSFKGVFEAYPLYKDKEKGYVKATKEDCGYEGYVKVTLNDKEVTIDYLNYAEDPEFLRILYPELMNCYSIHSDELHGKMRVLENVDVSKMMDISNAKESTKKEVSKILGVEYFDYEEWYETFMKEYEEKLNSIYEEDEEFYDVVEVAQ